MSPGEAEMGGEVKDVKNFCRSRHAHIAALTMMLLVVPALALADTGLPAADLNRVRNYVGCSLGIAGAATGLGLTAAVFFCLLLLAEP